MGALESIINMIYDGRDCCQYCLHEDRCEQSIALWTNTDAEYKQIDFDVTFCSHFQPKED